MTRRPHPVRPVTIPTLIGWCGGMADFVAAEITSPYVKTFTHKGEACLSLTDAMRIFRIFIDHDIRSRPLTVCEAFAADPTYITGRRAA